MDIIQDVLIYQTQMMRNSSLEPYVPADFSPPEYVVVVNALFYASLGVMLLAAFVVMLIKTWVREFDRGLQGMPLPEQRAKTREFRFLGMERWKIPEIVGVLPLLIQISLVLFFIGLIVFLFHINTPAFGVTTAIFGIGFLYYAITTSISVFVASSPFRSPLSRALVTMYRRAHAYFCRDIHYFESPAMDMAPETALGRVHRAIQIILQKSRPYLETNFEIPIAETATDEVQLSTVASALRRIHDSAPNSKHSEALLQSVWQVAGAATLSTPPLFNMPDWILWRVRGDEYLSHLPPAKLVALLATSVRGLWQVRHVTIGQDLLHRMEISNVPLAQVVVAVFDHFRSEFLLLDNSMHRRQMRSNLANVAQRKGMPREESLWLLNSLSEIHGRPWQGGPFLIEICLAVLSDHAPKWDDDLSRHSVFHTPADIPLLEAVVTLAAMSLCPEDANRLHILTRSREHPWLFLNVRNPGLFANWFHGIPSDYHKQLISLLFLVVYALICRRSYPLAIQYFTVITEKGELPVYTSAFTAIAPAMRNRGLSVIGRLILSA